MRFLLLAAIAAAIGLVTYSRQPRCDVAWIGDSIFSQMRGKPQPAPFTNVCNLGKSGAPASEIAKMSVPSSARVVFFEGGINDVLSGWPDDGIFEAYREGIARLANRRVVALGILPVSQARMPDDYARFATPERLLKVNTEVRRICASFSHCRWGGWSTHLNASKHTSDGIHLNELGQAMLVGLLAKDLPDN